MTDTIIVDVSIRGQCDELAAAGYLAGMKGSPLARKRGLAADGDSQNKLAIPIVPSPPTQPS